MFQKGETKGQILLRGVGGRGGIKAISQAMKGGKTACTQASFAVVLVCGVCERGVWQAGEC